MGFQCGKSNRGMLNFGRWFLCQFSSYSSSSSFNSQGIDKPKIEKIAIKEGKKLKIVKGCLSRTLFVSIFSFFVNAVTFPFIVFVKNTPFWLKNASKVWKTYSSNLTLLLGCCGRPTIWLITLLFLSNSCSAQLVPKKQRADFWWLILFKIAKQSC